MNPETKNLSRITGAATGTGLAVGSDQDWLQVIGIILAAISTLAPILQNLLAKKRQGNDRMLLLSAFFMLPFFFVGCGTTVNTQTDGTSISGSVSNGPVAIVGEYDGVTGEWHVGIQIQFVKGWPDDDTKDALLDAGAHLQKDSSAGSVWILPGYDRTNPFHGRALELALARGAVLTGVSREGAKGAK